LDRRSSVTAARGLQNFDIVHIFGLYDLLGSGSGCRHRKRRICHTCSSPSECLCRLCEILAETDVSCTLGKAATRGGKRIIATSEQEAEELVAGGPPRTRRGAAAETAWKYLNRGPHEARPEGRTYFRRCETCPLPGASICEEESKLLLQAFGILNARGNAIATRFAEQTGGVKGTTGSNGKYNWRSVKGQFVGPVFGEPSGRPIEMRMFSYFRRRMENFWEIPRRKRWPRGPRSCDGKCGIAPPSCGEGCLVVRQREGGTIRALERILREAELRARAPSPRPECAAVTSRLVGRTRSPT